MQKLIDILLKETDILKEEYIDKTEKWAKENFIRVEGLKKWTTERWCKYFNIEPRMANPGSNMQFLTFPTGFYNTKNSKTYSRMQDEISKILRLGLSEYISHQKQYAEKHYVDSIQKLAYRCQKENLDIENIRVHTSKIGVNIDTLISDGHKTIKASTIIASGEVQRPHYRYLIKVKNNDK